ncbi:unnamed protein product [Linum tenue]|uniref:Uncharacterized protein n=1 Tax=Linum tenue TaxID=586396 RepID=A0AAV0Q1Q2_9ROSI|nr:unnamed protein product [Linum tenue]
MSPILRRTKIPRTFIPQILGFASRSIKSFRFPGEPLDSSSITYGVHVFQCPVPSTNNFLPVSIDAVITFATFDLKWGFCRFTGCSWYRREAVGLHCFQRREHPRS